MTASILNTRNRKPSKRLTQDFELQRAVPFVTMFGSYTDVFNMIRIQRVVEDRNSFAKLTVSNSQSGSGMIDYDEFCAILQVG